MSIIELTVLRVELKHLLIVQMHNASDGQFVQQFYDYTDNLQPGKLVHEIADDAQTNIEPFDLDLRHCFMLSR